MNAQQARGRRGKPLPIAQYGRLIKEKHKCVSCKKYGKITTKTTSSIYAVYTSRQGLVCRGCAKEAGVI